MLPRILIAALVFYCFALFGAAITPHIRAPLPPADTTAVLSHSHTILPDPLIGFAINFHHTQDLSLYLKAVDEIAALGFNSLEIVTPAFQENGASQSIDILHGPGLSPTREDLIELLLYARSKGLSTTLMPIVLFTKPRGNEWRGKISPERWSPWWESYEQMVNYFVTIAIESDVQLFCIGSELLSTETDFQQWQRLIKHVRSRYHGKLIYSTNWDHYHTPTFWSQLDYIGVSGYWDLTTLSPSNNPGDPDSLAKRWIQIRERLLTFSNAQKRPVIMTEVGYPTLPWALQSPWNYVASGPKARIDTLAQAAGYRAFLSAWEDLLLAPAKRLPPQFNINTTPNITPNFTPLTSPNTDATTQPSPTTDPLLPYPVSMPLTGPLWPEVDQATSKAAAPIRQDGFMGFYFYAWDVYQQGGPKDTGYGVRNKPAYDVIKNFMQYHGFEPVTPHGASSTKASSYQSP